MEQCRCKGYECIVGFLCRDAEGVREFLQRCDLISKNIMEEVNKIPTNIPEEDQDEMRDQIIYDTYRNICDSINHPHTKMVLDDVCFQLADSCGFYRKP
ncbi:hypothetical protein KAR91_46905 [Candidatus Pacearchaeota archaeon]|nr:hypothetical protein [Candidatus Pacearchaeota archaeon]